MSPFRLRLFGPFALEPNAPSLSRKGRWLLSLLALRHGREIERSWLAGTLWPETTEELALYNLRRELSRLRRALGSAGARLGSHGAQVLALDVSGASVDVIAFDQAIARGDVGSLSQAVALYSGPLLEGCHEEWIVEERESRAQAFLAALETLAGDAMERGEPAEAVRYLQTVVAADPLRESAQRGLIAAHADTGAYGAATKTYRDLRLTLRRDLQAEPAPQTRALHQEIRAEARALAAAAPAAVARGRIPRPLTRLVGRRSEIAAVCERVRSSPLVTLIGTGGVGKSRLAVEAGRALLAEFPDGVWFVEIASHTEPTLVASAVASAIGVRGPSPRAPIEVLPEFLREQRVLLILDNCEHLIGACAELAARLLEASEGLRMLVTSRQPLGLRGEVTWRVPSLPGDDAVQLFMQRADDVHAQRSPRESFETVSFICRRLDGIPLAIELAAARTKALSIEQIGARLDDQLHLLADGSRLALPRHQTLYATMEWSYRLLDAAEQELLWRLSVFAGGWTLEAASEVCGGDVLNALSSLVEKSLVVFDHRYRMLETVRQYVRGKLAGSGEEVAVRARHCAYYVRWAEAVAPHIFGGERDRKWFDRIEEEHDNISAAFDWAQLTANDAAASGSADGAVSALRLLVAIHWFWFARSHLAEARQRVAAVLRWRQRAPADLHARALAAAGYVAFWSGDFDTMRARLAESLALAVQSGDEWLRVYSLCGLGASDLLLGNAAEGRPKLEQAAALARHGEKPLLMFTLYWRGSIEEAMSDFGAARDSLEEGLALARAEQIKPALAHLLHRLGHCAHVQGATDQARLHYTSSLAVLAETGDQWGISQTLDSLGCLAVAEGDPERAAMLLGAAEALRQRVGAILMPGEQHDHERSVVAARGDLGLQVFAEAWEKGRGLGLDQALEIARTAPPAPAGM